MSRTARLHLQPTANSVAAARRFVSDRLEDWAADDLVWAAQQVVSELATNALLHGRTDFTVSLQLVDDRLRLSVSDASPRRPVRRQHTADATTGRGLALVAVLAAEWGVAPHGSGKTVWCDLTPTPADDRGPATVVQLDAVTRQTARRSADPREPGAVDGVEIRAGGAAGATLPAGLAA